MPRAIATGSYGVSQPRLYNDFMADRAELERNVKEIRAQLDWVRDYL